MVLGIMKNEKRSITHYKNKFCKGYRGSDIHYSESNLHLYFLHDSTVKQN